METRRENVEEIKKCIKECLHNDTTIKFVGGRSSGRTYELITAMSECLYELNKTNKELISNQKSMKMTTDVLIRRIDKALDILDNYSIDYASLMAGYENANDNIVIIILSIKHPINPIIPYIIPILTSLNIISPSPII